MAVDLRPLVGNVDWSPAAARAAELAASAHMNRARGKWGNPEPLLEEEAEASELGTYHIFNVGPWNDWARLGSWGDWFLPAKPEDGLVTSHHCPPPEIDNKSGRIKNQAAMRCFECDKPLGSKHENGCICLRYAYCCSVPGIYLEHGLNGEGDVQSKHIKGLLVAQNIIGEGGLLRGHNDDNRAKNGVFICSLRGRAGRTPTEEDLDAAESRLLARFHELVEEANDARALGGPNAILSINEKHHLAAKRINRMDLDWAKDRSPVVSFRCSQCNRPCPETATRCECGFVLKPAEFWAQVQQGQIIIPGVVVPEMYRLGVMRVEANPPASDPPVAAPVATTSGKPAKPSATF